jgi:hypothetical protein
VILKVRAAIIAARNSGTDAAVSRLLNFFIRATEEKKGALCSPQVFGQQKNHMIMTLLHAHYPEAICTLECHCFYPHVIVLALLAKSADEENYTQNKQIDRLAKKPCLALERGPKLISIEF